ncbi:MAG: MAE_28990/MAE_18760 family HEPN-like nuclease [Rivularia sp. (in: cyanobacteria)]|jgi:hypothetical protein
MNNSIFEAVKEDFEKRSKEVSKYFMFLKSLEQGTTKLTIGNGNKRIKTREIDSELEKTLKASGFLLLYNLVEATMRNAIEAIFDELRSQKVSFNKIKPGIKKIILHNIKNLKVSDEVISQITDISIHIVNTGFNKEKLFSGNIDGRVIKTIAQDYGFSCETDARKTGNGSDLLTIKSNRNDLAHGIKSFAEVGREKSADELVKIKSKVIKYLKQILLNIEKYLFQKEYLHSI